MVPQGLVPAGNLSTGAHLIQTFCNTVGATSACGCLPGVTRVVWGQGKGSFSSPLCKGRGACNGRAPVTELQCDAPTTHEIPAALRHQPLISHQTSNQSPDPTPFA